MSRTRRRSYSRELDVFEATLYFSGEVNGVKLGLKEPERGVDAREEAVNSKRRQKVEKKSSRQKVEKQSSRQKVEKQSNDKKSKTPSPPGGKLAIFLNSIIHQTASKKKISTLTTQSIKDEMLNDRHVGRRSISYCESISGKGCKAIFASTKRNRSSTHVSTNSIPEDQSCLQSKFSGSQRLEPFQLQPNVWRDKTVIHEAWQAEKAELINWQAENKWVLNGSGSWLYSNDPLWAEVFRHKQTNWFSKREDEDDSVESESSSDLFELKIYKSVNDLSNDLPVYGTTNLEIIRRRAPKPVFHVRS